MATQRLLTREPASEGNRSERVNGPVASWSSIEFTGRWKALHYAARRFFAPSLVSAHVEGDETTIAGNYRRSTVRRVHLFTVHDAPQPATGSLRWELRHLDGRTVGRGAQRVALRSGESRHQRTLDLAQPLAKFGREHVYLRIALDIGGVRVSEETVFLAPPRFLNLPRAPTQVRVTMFARNQARLTFRSPVFQHRFAFTLSGIEPVATSDNFFELYPNGSKSVQLVLPRLMTAEALRKKLKWVSLVDSHA